MQSLRRSALRFAVTGVGATLVHIIVATSSIELLDLRAAYANGLAFIVANVFSYCVNTLWSFQTKSTLRNAGRFWLASSIGFLLAMGVSGFAEQQGWHYFVGIGLVILVVPTISFLVHRFWTFR